MSQKSSTFVQQTRERETWLTSGGEGIDPKSAEQSLAVAALVRGVAEEIRLPEGEEERARAVAVAEMQDMHLRRSETQAVQAPWYLKLGHALRYVFTLGRRR
jgi:hypothetical protein